MAQLWMLKKMLQRYLGDFLLNEISTDQLHLELANGRGELTDLELNSAAVNEVMRKLEVPLEMVDGYVGRVEVKVPGLKVLSEKTELVAEEVQLTFRKARGDGAHSMLRSISSENIASLVLDSITRNSQGPSTSSASESDVSTQFSKIIKLLSSKFNLKVRKITIRFENEEEAVEIRVERAEFEFEKSGKAERTKNVIIEGVSMHTDQISKAASTAADNPYPEPEKEDVYHSCYDTLTPNVLEGPPVKICEIPGPIRFRYHENCQETVKEVTDKDITDKEVTDKEISAKDVKMELEIPKIEISASLEQLEVVKRVFDSLTSSILKSRPMTDEDFQEVMSKSYQLLSGPHQDLEDPSPSNSTFSIKIGTFTAQISIPTDQGSYPLVISTDNMVLDVVGMSKAYFKCHMLRIMEDNRLETAELVKVSNLRIGVKESKVEVNFEDCHVDFDVEKVERIQKTLQKTHSKCQKTSSMSCYSGAPTIINLTGSSTILTLRHGASGYIHLKLEDVTSRIRREIQKTSEDLKINFLCAGVLGFWNCNSEPILNGKDFEISAIFGAENENEIDIEIEDPEDCSEDVGAFRISESMTQSIFSAKEIFLEKIDNPYSRIPHTVNLEKGEVLEIHLPGTREEMKNYQKNAKKSVKNAISVSLSTFRVMVPDKKAIEDLKKFVDKVIRSIDTTDKTHGAETSNEAKFDVNLTISMENCVVLCEMENPLTIAPTQLSIHLNHFHFCLSSTYLNLTSSTFSIGFCAKNQIPKILTSSDFGRISGDHVQVRPLKRKVRTNADGLAMVVRLSSESDDLSCESPFISMALRNSEIQAGGLENPETSWIGQLKALLGVVASKWDSECDSESLKTSSSSSSSSESLQITLEAIELLYNLQDQNRMKFKKFRAKIGSGHVIKRALGDEAVKCLLDNLRLDVGFSTSPTSRILETGSVQIDVNFKENLEVRCANDVVRVSLTASELAKVLNEFRRFKGEGEGLLNPQKPSEDVKPLESLRKIEKALEEAMREDYSMSWMAEESQKLYVVEKEEGVEIQKDSGSHPSSFKLQLYHGRIEVALRIDGSEDSVVLKLQKTRLTHQTTQGSTRSHLEIGEFEVKDRIKSSSIDRMIHRSARNRGGGAGGGAPILTARILENSDGTGAIKVSMGSDVKLNLDQDAVQFLEGFWKCLEAELDAPNDLVLVDLDLGDDDEDEDDALILVNHQRSPSPPPQPMTYFNHVSFSPTIRVHVDYQGKSRIPRTYQSSDFFPQLLGALIQLKGLPLTLDRFETRRGFLGVSRCLEHALDHWKLANPGFQGMGLATTVMGSYAPISPLVDIGRGVVDLVRHPVEEYHRSGRVLDGMGRGVAAFGRNSASGVIGIAQSVTGAVQSVVEYGAMRDSGMGTVTRATRHFLGGLRRQLRPEEVMDELKKYGSSRDHRK